MFSMGKRYLVAKWRWMWWGSSWGMESWRQIKIIITTTSSIIIIIKIIIPFWGLRTPAKTTHHTCSWDIPQNKHPCPYRLMWVGACPISALWNGSLLGLLGWPYSFMNVIYHSISLLVGLVVPSPMVNHHLLLCIHVCGGWLTCQRSI